MKMDKPDQYSIKGDTCMKQAKKLLKGSFFGNLLSGKSERAEEALQLYKQAATNYKLAKRWDDAANAYLQCVECDKISKGHQAAEFYVQAANVKEKINTADCVKLLEEAIAINIQHNQLSNVAKVMKRIAEIYEKDGQYTLAEKYYREAAQKFGLQPNRSSDFNSCMIKSVQIGIYTAAPQYGELIKTLETVAEKYLSNKLTAPSAKQLYFKSILLYLAIDDVIGANQAMERYTTNDPSFYNTRQQKFCAGLIKSVKEGNLPLFSQQCFKFNQIIPLDKWKTTILTKIKALIPDEGNQGKGTKQKVEVDHTANADDDDQL